MSIPNTPIDIKVVLANGVNGKRLELRAETEFNGKRIGYVEVPDSFIGREVFEYSVSQQRLFVKDQAMFDHMVRRAEARIMELIQDTYYTRVAVGG